MVGLGTFLARLGKPQPDSSSRHPITHRHAKRRLERFDLPADGAVRQVQFAGGFRKAQAVGRDLEGGQRLERRQSAAHALIHRMTNSHIILTKHRLSSRSSWHQVEQLFPAVRFSQPTEALR